MSEASQTAPADGGRASSGDKAWLVAIALGVVSAGCAAATLTLESMPAWPSVSVGLFAVYFAFVRGPLPLVRAIGGLAGLAGVIIGGLKIAALWGLAQVL